MTRGTLFYYESDEKVWSSAEFNGDMYHGTKAHPEGMGDKVIALMTNLKSVNDFNTILREINKDYGYEEGNKSRSVGTTAIEEVKKSTIKWIDEERTDLKGDKDMDPREWEQTPTFRDVRTWQFWGTPNLSDYSYIYNNSGEDLIMTTRDNGEEMVIPNGCLGVLNYGSKDCLCKDGLIIDGMGNYEEDKADEKANAKKTLKKIKALAEFAYGNKNLNIRIMPDEVWEVTKECPKSLVIKKDNVELRINKPEPNKIWEFIYE